ncbi:hypothetical protein HOK00_01945 [bacterium]|nr:hypothetical protein [bacterium]
MIISFKFSVFGLKIDHQILKELGEFTIFCMKAISDKMELKDISNIIQINQIVIEKQLAFAISRKYLDNDFILTKKGEETVVLFEFINYFNEKKIEIALEHYVENKSKQLYATNSTKFDLNSTGYIVKDNLFDYKMQNKFDEIIKQDTNKIKTLLLNNFSNYKNIVEKHLEEFIFNINKVDNQLYYNYSIDKDEFISSLKNKKEYDENFISIAIPVLEVNKIFDSEAYHTDFINSIKVKFNNYKYFNLINGSCLTITNEHKHKEPNLKISPIISNNDVATKLKNIEIFSLDELLLLNVKTNIREFDEIKFLNIDDIMNEI